MAGSRPPEVLLHGRDSARADDAEKQQIEDVDHDQRQPRHQRAREDLADRDRLDRELALLVLRLLVGRRHHVRQDDEQGGGRDDLPQRSRRRHEARGQPRVVARAQHRRQRDHPHRDHRRSDDPRRRREQRADQDDGDAQAAAQAAEEPAHRLEQILRDAAALEHDAHQHEEGDGDQHAVGQHAEHPLAERAEQAKVHRPRRPAEIGERDGDAGDGERDRKAEQDRPHQPGEHQEVEVFGHARSRATSRSRHAADWISRRMQKAGIRDFIRNTAGMPPTEIGPSRIAHAFRTDGHDQ